MIFSTLFPNVSDPSGNLALAREVCSNSVAGAVAASLAKAAGFTAIAVNPVSGFVYCGLATLIEKTVINHFQNFFLKALLPSRSRTFTNQSRRTGTLEVEQSIFKACDAISKVTTVMLTTFAVGTFIPSLSLTATTGALTCVAALTLNALLDASLAKLKGQ